MIGRLSGTLLRKNPPELLIDVNGVGYELQAPMTTFYDLPELGQPVVLSTHLAVREDAHVLYGFINDTQRSLFRTLIKVNGVGPKLALTILSGASAEEFARTVKDNDVTGLTRLPGVGKKTAERLIIEMRDRLDEWYTGASAVARDAGQETLSAGETLVQEADAAKEAVSALIALGYKPAEASKMVSAVNDGGQSSEALIREALKGAIN